MSERLPPLELSDLKMRLLHGEPNDRIAALELLTRHGADAAPITPIVAQQYRLAADSLPSSLVARLYVATGSPELLSAIRAVGDWHRYSTWDKCDLLEAGVQELEASLRDYLGRNWERSSPERKRIVEALGQAGSAEALEYLRVIDFRMAENVRTEGLRLSREDHNLLEKVSHGADSQFLDAVKLAIEKLVSRTEMENG